MTLGNSVVVIGQLVIAIHFHDPFKHSTAQFSLHTGIVALDCRGQLSMITRENKSLTSQDGDPTGSLQSLSCFVNHN